MIYSMTGFGKANFELKNKMYSIEIKSLNSKQADIFMRLPNNMKELEIGLRKIVGEKLQRGKMEVNISSVKSEEATSYSINTEVLKSYQNELEGLDIPSNDFLGALLRLPNVVVPEENKLSEEEMKAISSSIVTACKDLIDFRLQEGKALEADLKLRIANIMKSKQAVKILAPLRVDRIRARFLEGLKSIQEEMEVNQDRLEQEMIFYIEKLDVTEEFVRLKAHCEYFEEILNNEEKMVGKKLNFISQEIGREINTLGSKANDADIQKHVVQMKDELEKIKEQVNNVL